LDLITPNVIDENKKNVVLINNPIDHDKINRLSENNININIVFAKYNIITIGRLVPYKQMDKVIKAFYRLNRKLQNQSQLIIIGRGDEELALKNLVKELKIDDKVVFIEFTNNPYAILKKCQLLVLASKREGFGMVVLEALVLGISVVVNSNDSGPKDIVMGGKYGYLFNNDDLDDLSKKIEKGLLNSKFDSEELIKGSKKYGKQKITSEYIKNIFD
jgi:glycosyltransferase involved in cell wall biosynthesis